MQEILDTMSQTSSPTDRILQELRRAKVAVAHQTTTHDELTALLQQESQAAQQLRDDVATVGQPSVKQMFDCCIIGCMHEYLWRNISAAMILFSGNVSVFRAKIVSWSYKRSLRSKAFVLKHLRSRYAQIKRTAQALVAQPSHSWKLLKPPVVGSRPTF